MPDTWAAYGVDANGDGVADPLDPEDAIPSAAVYDCAVAREVRDVPGDPVDNMLAAYNAGPGRVIEFDGVPPASWGDGETYDYVRHIRALEASLTASFDEDAEPAPSGEAARIVSYARQEIGTDYSWGGGGVDGPSHGIDHGADIYGYDCSGLTQYAVYQATDGRITLPETSSQQRTAGRHVDRADMRPGDLIVINHDGAWGHVGIYAGGGTMIHAPRTGKTVEETEVVAGYWSQFEWDIRRIV
jgi:cell wall-associated NlpC family hydrolase